MPTPQDAAVTTRDFPAFKRAGRRLVVVTAYDAYGNESSYSNEVSRTAQ